MKPPITTGELCTRSLASQIAILYRGPSQQVLDPMYVCKMSEIFGKLYKIH